MDPILSSGGIGGILFLVGCQIEGFSSLLAVGQLSAPCCVDLTDMIAS